MKTFNSIKGIAMLMLCLSISQLSLAQGVRFGLSAGYNLSKIQIDGMEDLDKKPGYQFGFFVSTPVAERFIVQPGMRYVQKGGKYRENDEYDIGNGTNIKYEYRTDVTLSYLEIPVEFKYFFTHRFNISAAPYISFLLNDKLMETSGECIGDACTAVENEIDDEEDDLQNTDLGIGIGLGYDITDHISFSANYQFGMNSLTEEDVDAFNRMMSFTVGYTF